MNFECVGVFQSRDIAKYNQTTSGVYFELNFYQDFKNVFFFEITYSNLLNAFFSLIRSQKKNAWANKFSTSNGMHWSIIYFEFAYVPPWNRFCMGVQVFKIKDLSKLAQLFRMVEEYVKKWFKGKLNKMFIKFYHFSKFSNTRN